MGVYRWGVLSKLEQSLGWRDLLTRSEQKKHHDLTEKNNSTRRNSVPRDRFDTDISQIDSRSRQKKKNSRPISYRPLKYRSRIVSTTSHCG
jgi:hypothetical protein